MNKFSARLRRAARTKAVIKSYLLAANDGDVRHKLVVHRSNKNFTAQVSERGALGDIVRVSVTTASQELKKSATGTKTVQAFNLGELLAKRAIEAGINSVAFDRNGFKYHGRVKAFVEGARKAGLNF